MKILTVVLILGAVLFGGFFLLNNYIYNEKQAVTASDPRDAQYGIAGKEVPLTNGTGVLQVEGGSHIVRYFGNEARGDLNADGISDVAFLLVQEIPEGERFFLAAAIQNTEARFQGTQAMMIGDNIAPQTTAFKDGKVVVYYAERRADGVSVGKNLYALYDPVAMEFGEAVQDFEGETVVVDGEMKTYTLDPGLSFSYRNEPEGYRISAYPENNDAAFVDGAILMLKSDAAALGERQNAEGPPTITIAAYTNTQNLSADLWADQYSMLSHKNLLRGNSMKTKLAGVDALRYGADGLYQMDVAVIVYDGFAYVLSGSYMESQALIRRDFEALLESLTFAHEKKP